MEEFDLGEAFWGVVGEMLSNSDLPPESLARMRNLVREGMPVEDAYKVICIRDGDDA
jgi:hypothetical protein